MSDQSFIPHATFLSLPEDEGYRRRAAFLVLPIPYDLTQSGWAGSRLGPAAILAASRQIEEYDSELADEPCRHGIATLPELASLVAGPEEMVGHIAEETKTLLAGGRFLAALGGEHTITLGLVKAHLARHEAISVVALDAHADLRNSYQGSRIGHATVLRRVAELAPLALVGYRSLAREEAEFLARGEIAAVTAARFKADPEAAWEQVAPLIGEKVYLTLDLDVLDPAVMPAVGTPEPGGFTWEETTRFLEILTRERRVVGCDLVEHLPVTGLPAPSVVAAKLLYRLLGLVARGQTALPA